ncbi:phosphopentomutase [Diorhabda sublineata]|uniref:phosphopentomutase n=1 Tax=Diorhabda sublineata TaxID=1163346 RepID=UPI0024E09D8C|nr:phosphopentomutase [Diorhabda sublineata]XP_056647882.1 phosphopentomutase [Diorhabda sublineata]XP_056647884.1 phosphopentomutase [Diorhabda sublineata]XP_056647885.1 phosphopentomutase [Diorhabda sublineata]XP_056647886.1 phosphopentomutase [Diorhabda sublineata]XP_056647887.1 phosphopentomutase [Diorhabda sublineata]
MCDINTGCAALDQKVAEWLFFDKNETTANAIRSLLAGKQFDEINKLLCKRLTFGTAGLRGKMGPGYACMNDLVIIQTAQGFLKYLIKSDENLLKESGIVVGYDGRHNSRRWAELTAAIFIHAGYPVKLFSTVCPTPFVPYTVRQFKCASGVMVTASHNPKDDNGYKVYGPNGAQIISPVDEQVQASILENLVPLDTSWDTSILSSSSLLMDPLADIFCRYTNVIYTEISEESKNLNKKMNLLFTYTPMHGVGYKFIEKIFEVINVKFNVVQEQKDPHPDFPTVKFPNPEEGKESLDLSFKTADSNGSTIILANDPDADRLAVAEKNPRTGNWKVFNGNETGTLLGWWILNSFKKKNPDLPLDKIYMLSSTVSSMILKTMSKKEGFKFLDTLTGFKWLGNKALELEQQGNKVIFCFEEAIGFLVTTEILDKDGVSTAAQVATMASYIYSQNKTLDDQLNEIFDTYGLHISCNSYYICHEPAIIKEIFTQIRNAKGKDTYPQSILNGKYKITSVRDLTTGYDNNQPDNKAILPVSAASEMITFNFENGLVCTLRTSGTEPKIKYYTEMCATPEIKDKQQLINIQQEMVKAICEEMLQPSKYNLKPQGS